MGAQGERAAFDRLVAQQLDELLRAARRELRYRIALGALGPDDLSPEERARVERRLVEMRERLEVSRERMSEARERLIESRVEQRVRGAAVRARAAEVRARAGAEAAVRAMPTVVWPRRWMD